MFNSTKTWRDALVRGIRNTPANADHARIFWRLKLLCRILESTGQAIHAVICEEARNEITVS